MFGLEFCTQVFNLWGIRNDKIESRMKFKIWGYVKRYEERKGKDILIELEKGRRGEDRME